VDPDQQVELIKRCSEVAESYHWTALPGAWRWWLWLLPLWQQAMSRTGRLLGSTRWSRCGTN